MEDYRSRSSSDSLADRKGSNTDDDSVGSVAPRFQVHLETRYQVSQSDGPEFDVQTTTLNVSTSGCALDTQERFEEIGSTVQIHIALPPSGSPVFVAGEVVWTTPPQTAPRAGVIVPGTMGVAYSREPVPPAYAEYLQHLENARQSVHRVRMDLVNELRERWPASESLSMPSRFDIAIKVAVELISASAPDEAHRVLAEAIDVARQDTGRVSTTTINTAIDLYGELISIRKLTDDSGARSARLESLRRRLQNWEDTNKTLSLRKRQAPQVVTAWLDSDSDS